MMRLLIAFGFVGIAASAAAQDTLEPIRQLYASADYEGALSVLSRLAEDTETSSTIEIDRYRVLCLFALGRTAEAEQRIQEIFSEDPLYSLSSTDAPPRIRAAFSAVRRRVLPGLIRSSYAEGKAAYDRKEFQDALQKFARTLELLDNPDAADQADLADLRTLTSGFLDLSRAAAPAELRASTSIQRETPAPLAPSGSAQGKAGAVPPSSVEPVALRQTLPPWIGAQGGVFYNNEFSGSLDVDIDERGLVTGAQITEPIHPLYDELLLQAARTWRYEPARYDGQPIKARKRVNVVLRPR